MSEGERFGGVRGREGERERAAERERGGGGGEGESEWRERKGEREREEVKGREVRGGMHAQDACMHRRVDTERQRQTDGHGHRQLER
eukprot:6209465-Pleurochrysis_carterae.AAC.2